MVREPSENPIDQATRRLEAAVARLERKLGSGAAAPLFDADRDQLAAELERSRAREHALETAGAAASDALGRAIAEIRAALAAPAPEAAGE